MSLSKADWHGLMAWAFEDDLLRVVIVPEWGAKIASIFDKTAGREWLTTPTIFPVQLPVYAQDYGAHDMNSWDEMFPTIVTCPNPAPGKRHGVMLPDHGEVWALPWRREDAPDGELRLSVEGRALPYRLTRSAALDGPGTLRLRYQAANLGDEPMPYLWAAHPLFAVNVETRIVMPPDVREVYNVMDKAPWGKHGVRFSWPAAVAQDGTRWHIDQVGPVSRKDCRKFFAPPEIPVSWAALQQGNRHWLRLDWSESKDKLPYLGLWIDEGTYYHKDSVAAPEPTNAFYDGLDTAFKLNHVPTLPPGGSDAWTVRVSVGAGMVE